MWQYFNQFWAVAVQSILLLSNTFSGFNNHNFQFFEKKNKLYRFVFHHHTIKLSNRHTYICMLWIRKAIEIKLKFCLFSLTDEKTACSAMCMRLCEMSSIIDIKMYSAAQHVTNFKWNSSKHCSAMMTMPVYYVCCFIWLNLRQRSVVAVTFECDANVFERE